MKKEKKIKLFLGSAYAIIIFSKLKIYGERKKY